MSLATLSWLLAVTMAKINKTNRRKLQKLLNKIEADVRLGGFVYAECFPGVHFAKQDVIAKRQKAEMLGK